MYLPLVKAFNYALYRLSGLKVPGLPKLREGGQIVFARSATKCIKSESYLQGSYKPDIVLVKWNTFKRAHECANAVYSESYQSDICHESSCDQPRLSWRNLLSTLEVKRGRRGGAGNAGNGPSKGKAKGNSVQPTYAGEFGDLPGPEEVAPLGPLRPAPLKMVSEENPTRARKPTASLSFLMVS